MLAATIALVLLGIMLILMEILFVPGIGVVGIIGVAVLIIGVVLGYQVDNPTGHITLAFSIGSSAILLWLSLRAKTWERMALKTKVEGKANEVDETVIMVGAQGEAISRLAPMGKALFGSTFAEVTTNGSFVDEGTSIRVVKIKDNKIIVEPT